MHSSRMRTACLLTLSPSMLRSGGGGAWSRGGGVVPGRGGGCLPGPGGYLVWGIAWFWGVPGLGGGTWSWGYPPGSWRYLPGSGGVPTWSRGRGVPAWSRGVSCSRGYLPGPRGGACLVPEGVVCQHALR